jgi:hypothetical protein
MMKPKTELPEYMIKMIDGMAEEIEPIVHNIENGMMAGLYENNYPGYLSAIGDLVPGKEKGMLAVVGYSMVDCGGNYEGICGAIRILTGEI